MNEQSNTEPPAVAAPLSSGECPMDFFAHAEGRKEEIVKWLRMIADALESGAGSGRTGVAWKGLDARWLTHR